MANDTKLVCIITGKALVCAKDYYDKKVKAANSEDKLKRTYVCRDAKKLLKRGYSVDECRSMLNVTTDVQEISKELLAEILEAEKITDKRRILSDFDTILSIAGAGTDPEVKEFIDNLGT
tara:strand:+ start:6874 stop:7233 length:360 start_codon:yes stop_codon:yes gene_type:complete